jgi:5-methylcytosine-specific restriction enzyme subunit McrC
LNPKNTIRVFEHQKLYFSDFGPFQESHWKALARYAEFTKEQYFTVLGRGIKFSNYVGVIQAGNLTIEVLPKTDSAFSTADNIETSDKDSEKKLWHKVLVQMLKECRLLKADQSNRAFLKLTSQSLLDIYIELFLSEAEKIVHEGLVKKYREVEGNQLSLKGQLLFSKNLSQNIIHQERFYIKHNVYNRENIFNQLLYKTVLTIPRITTDSGIHDKVNRIRFALPEFQDLKVSPHTFDKLLFDRKTERYKDALMISKLILLHFHPDISGGNENVVAILFDMNQLWEEFVYRRLKSEEKNFNIHVIPQSSKPFWMPANSFLSKTLRPDMVLSYTLKDQEEKIILDTKWKVLKNLTPSDDDLRQMFVYNLLWKCKESVLIYPANANSSSHGDYQYKRSYLERNLCSLKMIGVLNDEHSGLHGNFGAILLETILGKAVTDRLRY